MPAVEIAPRLLSKAQAASYLGLTKRGFDRWRRDNKVPPPLPGTARWDKAAIDAAIDSLSKLGGVIAESKAAPNPEPDPLLDWMKKRDERKNRGR